MDAKVTWHQGLTFSGTAESGFNVPLGASEAVGGANDGFRPLELMAISLAGCTAMDVISILMKKRQAVRYFNVEVQAEQAEGHPRVFTRATITYHVSGHNIDEKDVLRAIELSATTYCPAQNMLSKVLPIELKYAIYEAEEGSHESLLSKSGTFNPPMD